MNQPLPEPDNLITVDDLTVLYETRAGSFGGGRLLTAVDGVSFAIRKGETLGLVGESGCGKSTLGRAILRLTEAERGSVEFKETDLLRLSRSAMQRQRKHLQMIFQDPLASLNPRMTIGKIIAEPIKAFGLTNGKVEVRVHELLEKVSLDPKFASRYPGEFSGGQLQRIGIARAMAAEPEFIVADEPISALDVSIQAQILNLLKKLQIEEKLTLLFISHDLRAVRHISDRIAVMYLGKIVEIGLARDVYDDPLMPYTQALISAAPVPNRNGGNKQVVLKGEAVFRQDRSGCLFRSRCPFAIRECEKVVPALTEIKPGHFAACIRISREHPDVTKMGPDSCESEPPAVLKP